LNNLTSGLEQRDEGGIEARIEKLVLETQGQAHKLTSLSSKQVTQAEELREELDKAIIKLLNDLKKSDLSQSYSADA